MSFLSKKIIILVVIILTTMVSLLIFIPSVIFPKDSIQNEISNGTVLSNNKKDKIKGGWEGFKNRCDKVEIVMTKYDIFNPRYTLMCSNISSALGVIIQDIQLERIGLFEFRVKNYVGILIENTDLEKSIETVQKYDLSSTNPDPQNITVFPSR